MDNSVTNFIVEFGEFLGGEYLSLLLIAFCYASILLLWRHFGVNGLYVYNTLAVVAANIQVLKVTDFMLSPEPVALGTLVFATTFLVSDIITEHKGVKAAHDGIKLAFLSQIIMTIFMIFTIAYPSANSWEYLQVQGAMETIFSPSLRILIASLISFYFSQWIDIKIFKYLKDKSKTKHMWFRINAASLISGLIDNIIFSTLAWVILSPNPVGFKSLIFVYILGTYGARVVISLTSTPIMYLTHKFKPVQ